MPSLIVQLASANTVPHTIIVIQSLKEGTATDPIMAYVRRRVAAAAQKAIEERIVRTRIAGTESKADPINRKEAMSSIHKVQYAGGRRLRGSSISVVPERHAHCS